MTRSSRGVLLELLPVREASMGAGTPRLAVTPRTLKQRLGTEGRSSTAVLNATWEDLAQHYLESSTLSGAEISFLLGFGSPSSLLRASRDWIGEPASRNRATLLADA